MVQRRRTKAPKEIDTNSGESKLTKTGKKASKLIQMVKFGKRPCFLHFPFYNKLWTFVLLMKLGYCGDGSQVDKGETHISWTSPRVSPLHRRLVYHHSRLLPGHRKVHRDHHRLQVKIVMMRVMTGEDQGRVHLGDSHHDWNGDNGHERQGRQIYQNISYLTGFNLSF